MNSVTYGQLLAFLLINFLASKKVCFNFKIPKMPDSETEHPVEQDNYTEVWAGSGQFHGREHMTLEMKKDLKEAASQLSLSLVSITYPDPQPLRAMDSTFYPGSSRRHSNG